jgi:tetraacyldisaccharide 4'-kinase
MTGIERTIRRYNPDVPVFRSRMVAEPWNRAERKVGAFCGIGSPRAFWRTLEGLGLEVVSRSAFEDHHSYTVAEVERVAREAQAAGAQLLVTTEKDMMNLPEGLHVGLPLECVRIGVQIENEDALLALIRAAMERA